MAVANNIIETRIQLKSDTEANWILHPIVPLQGELIIYLPDNTHEYSRVKIGDGHSNTNSLPFIDSGSLNGKEVELVKIATRQQFPAVGSPDKLYVDLLTNRIFHYTAANGYSQLSNFQYTIAQTSASDITHWRSGRITSVTVQNHVLKIQTGLIPELLYEPRSVVSSVEKEVVTNE